jgi:hypothetical protein
MEPFKPLYSTFQEAYLPKPSYEYELAQYPRQDIKLPTLGSTKYETASSLRYDIPLRLPPAPVFLPIFMSPYNPHNTSNFLIPKQKEIWINARTGPEIVQRCRGDCDCPKNFRCMSGKCELDWTIRNPI